jgi:V8-like Glu-specific endopeptidase
MFHKVRVSEVATRMQSRTLITTIIAVCALMIPAGTAGAITNGQADQGQNPSVGALVSYDPETGDKYLICSGTLIKRDLFVTAAHCLLDEPSDLYVSFESFVGAPDVGPDVRLYHGQATGHPEFEDETAPGDTHDVAVVVLDEPVRGIKPARLPFPHLLDLLDNRRNTIARTPFRVAGYGREGYDAAEDAFFGGGSRRFAFSPFKDLESNKLFLSQAGDEGGTCRGDSGGPVFVGKTDVIVGVTSDGDPNCVEEGVYYRLDTKSALSFIRSAARGGRLDD